MMRTLYRFFLLASLAAVANAAYGQSVSLSEGEAVARDFFSQRGLSSGTAPKRIPYAATAQTNTAPYYIFNAPADQGFVIVAGNKQMPSVLGYVETGGFSAAELPPAMKNLLLQYATIAQQLNCTAQQQHRIVSRAPASNTYKAVSPLLRSSWHQEAPYNGSCPYYTYDDGTVSAQRSIVGCVATSLSQVINYYRRPATIQHDIKGWKTAHYTIPDLKEGTPIDWDNLLDRYDGNYTSQQAKAVADLCYYCGVVSTMNWSPGSSGANMWNLTPKIKKAFGYKYARAYDHFLYTPQRWADLLHRELENGRPLMYAAGNVEMTSHAFNIDGCDANGLYHVDWGYGGIYNGYFDINVLEGFEPAEDTTEEGIWDGLFCNQMAIAMHPDTVIQTEIDTLAVDSTDVTVDSVCFRRPPDTNGYVRVDFYLHNHLSDTIAYPMEMMCYQPTDSLIFLQADYVGLTGGMLLPNAQTRVSAFCHFSQPGNYTFGYSYDDVHIPYTVPITVTQTAQPALSFPEITVDNVTDNSATLTTRIVNDPSGGWSGDLMTYCLFPEGSDIDTRHFTFLNLAPGATLNDTKTFKVLQPGTTYTLKARCSWSIVAEKTFTTTGTSGITDIPIASSSSPVAVYSLTGQRVATITSNTSDTWKRTLRKGIYLVGGKKIIIN